MRNFRKLTALALALVMSLSLVACGGGEIGGETQPSGGASVTEDKMFNVVMTAAYTGFDPLKTNDAASTYVTAQIYETLYRIASDGSFEPLLAESLPEFSEDGMSATVKLREGITFHDGTPFNAEAVKYTFDLIKDPEFGSARASIATSIDTMECLDDYTIKFNLKYEDGVLLAKFAHTNSAIVSPTAQQNQDLMINPVGTGPYKYVSHVSGSNVVLTRYDEYWGKTPEIKDVTYTVITEESTALARLETGEADYIPSLTVESLARVESMQNVTLATQDSAQIYYVGLRQNSYINPLMANPEFRKAIVMALDREGFVTYTMDGHGSYAKSFIGPKVLGYTEAAEAANIEYDPEGARAIIEANGWQDEEIVFLCPSTPAYAPIGEYFQANLTAAGFNNVKLESIEYSAYLTESKAEDRFDVSLFAWANVTRDGSELLEPNTHSVSSARLKINSDELDGLIQDSKTTSVKEDRIAALEKANMYVLENALIAPIYNGEYRFAYNSAYTCSLDTSSVFYLYDFTIN